jgi:hypothetical protein
MGLYLICGYRPNMHHMKRRPLTSLVEQIKLCLNGSLQEEEQDTA